MIESIGEVFYWGEEEEFGESRELRRLKKK